MILILILRSGKCCRSLNSALGDFAATVFAAVGAYTNRLLVHSRHDIATGATMGAYTNRLGVHLRRHSIATGATVGAFMMGGDARPSSTPRRQFPDP